MRWFTDPEEIEAERSAAAALRRLPVRPRVVAFCAGAGGIGTTAVAAGVAATLVTLWPGRIAYAGLSCAPRLAGVHVEPEPQWTDQVGAELVTALTERFAVVVVDIGTHADRAARVLLSNADRVVVVTDADGRGEERVTARLAGPAAATPVAVAVRDGHGAPPRFGVPQDKAFEQLSGDVLERARPATCRALLRLAAWCV